VIYDLTTADLLDEYSIGIFTAGYETRSASAAILLSEAKVKFESVFIYSYASLDSEKLKKIQALASLMSGEIIVVNSIDALLFFVQEKFDLDSSTKSIFIDYSSMRRDIYASMLSCLRGSYLDRCIIDLCYTNARYSGEFSPLSIRDISAVEGSRYISDPRRKNAVFLGLGFDKISPVSVCELLEPDVVIPFLSISSPDPENDDRARTVNADFLSHINDSPILLPICSLSRSYQVLFEVVANYMDNHNCILVPMGPKPHVMACIMLSLICDGISCIHVSGSREIDVDAIPMDNAFTLTRVRPDLHFI